MAVVPVELTIDRLSQLGEGVAQWEGRAVFIAGALPGDRVEARVDTGGKVLRAELTRVLSAGPGRRTPPCPHAGRCGGCDWMSLDEARQREAREEIVRAALERGARLPPGSVQLLPTVPSPQTLGYRRRAALRWGEGGLGFFGRRTHEHVAVGECVALAEPLAALPGALTPLLGEVARDLAGVDLLGVGEQVSVALNLAGPIRPKHRQLAERTLRALRLRGVVLKPQEGTPELVGKPVLRAPAPLRPEVTLLFRPDAFTQANAEGAPHLVERALALLAPSPEESALELYSGNGLFSFALAARARSVLAVEGAPVSSSLAQKSAHEARVGNVRFVQGDVGKVCQGLAREGAAFDLLLADPPRTGAPGLGGWARGLGVRRLVYVACDVGALARDAAGLVGAGFRPTAVQLVEMFPQTHHVEAVMGFTREG